MLMAFTVNEFRDLLEILRTKPEWKAKLRRELLGEELLALPELVRRLTQAIEAMNERLYRVEQDVAELKADVAVLKTDVAEFKTDNVMLKTDVASLKEDAIERKYRERPFVYFRRILRKPKTLSDSDLDELLSKALADGALTEQDVTEIGLLDAAVRGRRVSDDRIVYLAVEVSSKIDEHDVERAVRRAKLLEKIPELVAVPVVAGEAATPQGVEAARQSAVWCVTNGHASVEVIAPPA